MEWTIQEVARKAGTTSRTLRHYDQIGLLSPSHIGHNGYRYYDATAVVRLQRILLLRELGMGLPEIAEVLSRNTDEIAALEKHREVLQAEVTRIARQVAAVEHSIDVLKGKEELDMSNTFDGFDHTQYKDEVEERWGRDAYAESNDWWNRLGSEGQEKWMQEVASLYPEHDVLKNAGENRFGMFDKVCGTDQIRTLFSKRNRWEDAKGYWDKDVESWKKLAKKYWFYK